MDIEAIVIMDIEELAVGFTSRVNNLRKMMIIYLSWLVVFLAMRHGSHDYSFGRRNDTRI